MRRLESLPVSMMFPPKVKRSTMAAQSRGSVKVFVQAERLVRGHGDAVLLLPLLGQHLEQQLRAIAVQFHVAEFVDLCRYQYISTYAGPVTVPRRLQASVIVGCAAVVVLGHSRRRGGAIPPRGSGPA
jgi:hypothetical protein